MNNNEQPKLFPNRFQPGNPGGPGRPKKETERAYLDAVLRALPPEQVVDVLHGLLTDAKSWRARFSAVELILAYGLGKPVQRTESEGSGVIEEAMLRWMEMKQQSITVVEPSQE